MEGELEITKTVESALAADTDVEFEFTITLDDETIAGDYTIVKTSGSGEGATQTESSVTFAAGKTTVKLKGGESVLVKGLPTSVGYTVVETENTDFTPTPNNRTESGTISTTKSTAAFTNKRITGAITVAKTVSSDMPSDKTDSYSFIVTLSDTGISGDYGEVTFDKGVATFTLSDGDDVTIENLPNNVTATVKEDAPTHMTTTFKIGSADAIEGLSAAGVAVGQTVTFTNTRDNVKVTLKKIVKGNMGDKNRGFTFTVTVKDKNGNPVEVTDVTDSNGQWTGTLSDGQTHVFDKLPVGAKVTIKETEANTDGYGTSVDAGTISGTDDGEGTYTFTIPASDCTVNYTNNKEVEIDTGVSTDSKPYLFLLGLIPLAGFGAVMMARKRRRDEA